MRFLDAQSKHAVQEVIDANEATLRAIPGFVTAEPGFPTIDGAILKEPAIIVFVAHKMPPTRVLEEDRAPRQLGPYRVSVRQADPLQQVMSVSDHAGLAARISASTSNLTYKPLRGNPINATFKVSEPMLCHVGPDAGWPVLKPFLEGTRKTLSVAMYDLNADYIAKTLIDTVRGNGLKFMLTWDDGMREQETAIRKKLRRTLKNKLDGWIVRCGASRRFPTAYHEKVAVRDSSTFWLSSGNWSSRSQPEIDPIGEPQAARGMYSKGNREWHIIVDDTKLAKLFEKYIKYDRDGSEAESAGDSALVLAPAPAQPYPDIFVSMAQLIETAAMAAAPVVPTPPQTLPSVARAVEVVPVLSPDNYIDRITELIESAKHSIYLQFSYISYSDRQIDKRFRELLAKLADLTYSPRMDVKIIVGSANATSKIPKLVENGFKETVFRTQSNLHNKGIVVDGKAVLVCSANWSGDGVLRNRDAGLIIHDEEIAGYYQKVFLYDWENRARSRIEDDPPAIVAAAGAETPPGMVRMSWQDYYETA